MQNDLKTFILVYVAVTKHRYRDIVVSIDFNTFYQFVRSQHIRLEKNYVYLFRGEAGDEDI